MTNNRRRFTSPVNPAFMLLLIPLIAVSSLQIASLLADEKQSTNYDMLILKVQESLKNKQFLEAMKFADQAIEKDPTQYEAFSLLAIAATQLGQKDIAGTAISQAVELANREQQLKLFPIWRKIDPEGAKQAAQERAEKGAAAYADGLAFQAAQLFEEAWRINPEETAWGLQSARAYLEIKKYLPGIPLLREAALSPDNEVASEADEQLQQISALIETIYKERMDHAAQKFKADDMVAAENNWMEAIEINPFRPDAYYELAQFYLAQDEQEQALKALKLAIRHGDRDPKRILNKVTFMGLWGNSDYLELVEGIYGPSERKRISEEYEAELDLEDPDYDLALKLYIGDGVTIDEGRAYKLFLKAADRGHALAKTFVAYSYLTNEFEIPKNRDEAIRWYRSARPALSILAKQGNPLAQVQFGRMYDMGLGVEKNYSAAINWYRKAAEQGNARAQYALGRNYMQGEGVKQDKAEAIKWYRKAAEQNYARAQNQLGYSFQFGEGVSVDDSEAFKWFRKAAEQGLARGQMYLGYRYYSGTGTEQDYMEALKWWRKAAQQGQVESQHNLGVMYSKGQGVDKNDFEAVKWYRKAVNQHFALAQVKLAKMYLDGNGVSQSDSEAAKLFRLAAEQGDSEAQFEMGLCLANGKGVAKNDFEAVKWYQKAADQGNAAAQNNLGNKYKNGQGIEQNLYLAANWFRKSSEQGNSIAQNNLGICYARGEGVNKNYTEAVKWYRRAAEQGHAAAQNNLGYKYQKGEGVEQDLYEAIKWFHKAAEQGNSDAQNNLGICYSKGEGVTQNYAEAAKWYRKAAEQGHAWAQNNLGFRYRKGQGVAQNKTEAAKWFRKAIKGTTPAAASAATKNLKSMGYTP